MSTGKLKVSLTGHVSSVRGLAVSKRHPYLFSCGEDKQVKCWDLEYNKVIFFQFEIRIIMKILINGVFYLGNSTLPWSFKRCVFFSVAPVIRYIINSWTRCNGSCMGYAN